MASVASYGSRYRTASHHRVSRPSWRCAAKKNRKSKYVYSRFRWRSRSLGRNLLATLRGREFPKAAKDIAAETGLEHRPITDGQRVVGTYRRSVMLASERYAMLDDGTGFRLVPWTSVIGKRPEQQLAMTVRGGGVSWEIGRQRGMSIA